MTVNQEANRDVLGEGHKLHWYEVKSLLGRGAFGVTYLARDKNLHQDVAIKEYFPNDFSSRDTGSTVHPTTGEKRELYEWGLSRFIREAQTLAQFRHPNIVRVMSVFELNNTAYMVMEYEQGEELSRLYKRKQNLSEQELLAIFLPILDGLKLVHDAGFIHRDIKPANIYIRADGSPVLIDFGAARQTIGTPTRAITSLVTYGYAPFEQYNESDEKQGPWTDIYALGACLYFAVNGKLPFDALGRGSSLLSSGIDPYEPVAVAKEGQYSSLFLRAIDHALMFHAHDRPQDIVTWADMLSGKIEAPPLPSELFKQPISMDDDDDATVIVRRPPHLSRSTAPAPSESVATAPQATSAAQSTVPPSSAPQPPVSPSSAPQYSIPQDTLSQVTVPPSSVPQSSSVPSSAPEAGGVLLYDRQPVITPEPEPETIPLEIPRNVKATVLILFVLSILGGIIDVWLDSGAPEETEQYVEQESLASLLASAEQAHRAGRLIEPETGAIYFYQRALAIEPENPEASKRIQEIIELYADGIRSDLEVGFFEQAQTKSHLLQAAAPDSTLVLELLEELRTAKVKQQDIPQLLQQADADLNAGNLIGPDNQNALSRYRRVLVIEPENPDAQQGIETILAHYVALAEENLAKGDAATLEANIDDILFINAESLEVDRLRNKLEILKTQHETIAQLLSQAQNAFESGNIINPSNENALNLYQRILKLDAKNAEAKQGIQNVERRLKSQFDKHLAAADLASAETVMKTIEKAMPRSRFARKVRAEWERSKQASRPDSEIISEMIGIFKQGFESRNIKALRNISEFRPNRPEFLQQFFNNYGSFRLEISGIKYFGRERKGTASIAIKDLINIYGGPVEPGSWSRFEIEIRKNNKGQWKVVW